VTDGETIEIVVPAERLATAADGDRGPYGALDDALTLLEELDNPHETAAYLRGDRRERP
jgi:hypothetical protein